jgi:hypothetical protein
MINEFESYIGELTIPGLETAYKIINTIGTLAGPISFNL